VFSSPQSDTSQSRCSVLLAGSDRPGGDEVGSSREATASESLELVPDAFSFYIGPTGAADIHLLKREDFDSKDIARPRIPGLRYRRVDKDQGTTIFGITDQSLLEKAEPRADEENIETAWSEFWDMLPPGTAWRLIKLYGRFVDPYFPI